MTLLPQPKKAVLSDRTFAPGAHTAIQLDPSCTAEEYNAAKLLKTEIEHSFYTRASIEKSSGPDGAAVFLRRTASEGEEYELEISENGATVTGGTRGIFYGVQTLRQIVRLHGGVWPVLSIRDEPVYPERGFYYDVTRGMVPTLQTLKELADRLAFYKINQLQLYVEHTFAFRGFSEAWTGKDPLTAEDILELDEYCRKLHIELVPSIATFGHLYEILVTKTWKRFSELDTDAPFTWQDRMSHHTLNVSDENSFSVVKKMLDQYIPLFTSNQFNICCDETFDIGRGKSRELAKKNGVGRLYVDFLKKIMQYVQSKGKKVLFWSDIILKTPDFLNEIPQNAECLFWDYSPNVREDGVRTIAQSGVEFGVCPGVCGWNVMMNLFEDSYQNISKLVQYGLKYGARCLLNTDWGDFGHINLFANSMPGMAMGAALSWNPEDKRECAGLLEAYFTLEFGAGASGLAELLIGLSRMQEGAWSDIVRWRESRIGNNSLSEEHRQHFADMDAKKLLDGYRGAMETEEKLVLLPCTDGRRQDMMEYICAARGVALINAACLALRKNVFGLGDTPALGNSELAEQIELWFADYTQVWRARSRESELYRIREALQDLCSFLRGVSD